ncbi:MAG: hypothetical protein E7133_08085 [Rikenellaceae bacterium]|nr:hypothetical protein [Rikenellaceae bacterium]MBE6214580.1 hypothetical protein [Rikenellaceae bacterium]
MKKFLLMAVAAVAMLATACTKDNDVVEPVEQTSEITFTISTIEYITRAEFGKGEQATDLYWAVYDQNTKQRLFKSETPATMTNLKAQVVIPFVNGMSYDVLFWAKNAAAPYDVDWDEATMAYTAGTLYANKESYDAFFCYHKVGLVSGPVSQDIKLKRPFAQVNIATADYSTAGFTVAESKVTVKDVYSAFNLRDGVVMGTKAPLTLNYATKPDGTITLDGKTYDILAVNYLLVGKDKTTIDITMDCKDGSSNVKSFNYSAVPVQQNYKTNIVGNLLSSGSSSAKATLELQ